MANFSPGDPTNQPTKQFSPPATNPAAQLGAGYTYTVNPNVQGQYQQAPGRQQTGYSPLANANIPGWENTELGYLSQQNLLYGLPPDLLGAIDQAESSGSGGSINSAGYGGYFGLGANSTYGPYTDTPALLQGTGPLQFGDQAVTAAYDFNQLLQQYGGNVYAAEQAYQTGHANGFGEGDSVFQALGIPNTLPSDPNAGASGPLYGAVQGMVNGANVTNQALSQQQALGGAQQSITDQQLLTQLQDTLQALGLSGQSLNIQQTGLQQQGAYGNQQYLLQGLVDALQKKGISQSYANLLAQYGFQQQQFGLQGTEIGQQFQQATHDIATGNAASGVYNTGTQGYEQGLAQQQRANALQNLGIQRGQAAQTEKYSIEQLQNQLAGLGYTETGQTEAHKYEQEQVANALAQLAIQRQQLGLQGTEAQQQYTFGTQGAANQYADLLTSILMQQGQNQMGLGGNIGSLLQQLLGSGAFSGIG